MRLLHTADWHLGRLLHRMPLLDAQAAAIDHLVELAEEEQVDAILVAGDLFDRALPPVEAVRLAGDALRRLAAIAPVVLVSGNHDSAPRLGFAAELIAAGGVHLRTDPATVGEPLVLEDEHGPVALYGIPYLDPELARGPLAVEERSHDAVLTAAMDRVRADLATRDGARSVVVAHAFVAGGRASESERDISVGGAQTVSPAVFAGVDYGALGHLHRPHAVGAAADEQPVPAAVGVRAGSADAELGGLFALTLEDEPPAPALPTASGPVLRYAGSPLPYSFSEAGLTKTTTIVDLDGDGAVAVRHVPVPAPFRLARLRGTLDELLQDPRLTEHEDDGHWLEVVLTDARLPARPMERLRRRFPRVLVLQHAPEGDLGPRTTAAERVRGRSDLEIVERFVLDVRGSAATADELPLLRAAVEHVARPSEG
ncbi:exonuclease SbcCD subunit D [Patulibacter defluvii]|uniref:exonuclease SbcCD subunit D n=1 Tax=Patulibacter defluvii TaxID=3095358 RepID=UPI002A764E58|nr:exonuclease SbcCD subunit D [Patulibacter sp. DM4]